MSDNDIYISRDKIKEMIQEYNKRLVVEESTFDINDIENRKACQYAKAKLTFLLEDIYKLNNEDNMEVKKYNQVLEKEEMTKEEAIKIIDEMYHDKIKAYGEGNVIHMDLIDSVKYTNLEFASVRILREEIWLEREIKKLKEELNNERMLNKSALETLKECVHKDRIKEKLEEIRKEYNNIISNDNVSLNFKNIYSHRYDAMSLVLEELLKGI